ncbi:response regulator, partial [Desulfobulbus sp. US5]|nr:response regulator [Desulfobulbus sp. US5]
SEQEKIAERSGTILIVDDEPQLRDIAARMLKSIGYTVDSVCSGELAIKYILDKPVDLIVIDMQMEPGMNGHDTYIEISKISPGQKAVIVSGFSDSADVKAALKLGANGFIKKPYSLDQLGRAVKEALCS